MRMHECRHKARGSQWGRGITPPCPGRGALNLAPPFAGRGRREAPGEGPGTAINPLRNLGSVWPGPQGSDYIERSAFPLTPTLSPRKSGARERAAVVAALFPKRPRDRILRLLLDL